MHFTLKDTSKTKCSSCYHAHIVKPERTGTDITFCRLLGSAISPIKECNQHLPHMHAPVPVHMAMGAWLIDGKQPETHRAGFRPPSHVVMPSIDKTGVDEPDTIFIEPVEVELRKK